MPICIFCGAAIEAGPICGGCEPVRPHGGKPAAVPWLLLSARDFAVLGRLQTRRDLGASLRAALRTKLNRARLIDPARRAPLTATLDSRVLYQVDTSDPQTRTLVADERRHSPGYSLPVTAPVGLALLGLAEGEDDLVSSGPARVRVLAILYHPEHARERGFFRAEADEAKLVPFRPRRAGLRPGSSDPGPSAA